jgi:hypothetical protein
MKKNRRITIRLEDDLHEFLINISNLDECSLSSVVRLFLMHNARAIQELKNDTNNEVAGWFLRQQAAMAMEA